MNGQVLQTHTGAQGGVIWQRVSWEIIWGSPLCSGVSAESPRWTEPSQAEVATHHGKLGACRWPAGEGPGPDASTSNAGRWWQS